MAAFRRADILALGVFATFFCVGIFLPNRIPLVPATAIILVIAVAVIFWNNAQAIDQLPAPLQETVLSLPPAGFPTTNEMIRLSPDALWYWMGYAKHEDVVSIYDVAKQHVIAVVIKGSTGFEFHWLDSRQAIKASSLDELMSAAAKNAWVSKYARA